MDGKIALQTIQSFKEIMSGDDYAEFIKGEDSAKLRAFPEVGEFLKAETGEASEGKGEEAGEEDEGESKKDEKKEEPEGELKKALSDLELAKAAVADKEAAVAKLQPAAEVTPVTTEMFKGLQDEISGKLKVVTDLLVKSIGGQDEIAEIKALVAKIAGTPQGTKAIKAGVAASFLEKALSGDTKDDDDRAVLSVSMNKPQVEKALEDAMEKAVEPELVKAYENSIMRYNAGGGTISQEVAKDLYEKHNIRLTK